MTPERVADYPRPPRLEPVPQRLRIVLGGQTIADTTAGFRVLETTHPPTYYLPPDAFAPGSLLRSARSSFCEWKGTASYLALRAGDRTAQDCAWTYATPTAGFEPIRDHIAVYPAAMDACFVGDEAVRPQPGGFYGGWITRNLVGPFKGGAGTAGW